MSWTKEKAREYARKYYAEHKDELRERHRKNREKKKTEIAERVFFQTLAAAGEISKGIE